MFNDDVSSIPTTGCNVFTDSDSISNYTSNVRKDFIFNGGKWYLYRTQTSYQNYDVSNYNCIDVSTVDSYAIYKPFLYGVAFMLFVCFFILVFKLIRGFLYVK